MVHPSLGPGRPLRDWIAQCRASGPQPWLAIPADSEPSFTLDSVLFPVEVAPDTDLEALAAQLADTGYTLFISPGELLGVVSDFDSSPTPPSAAPEAVHLRITAPGRAPEVHAVPSAAAPAWLEGASPGDVVTVEVLAPDQASVPRTPNSGS